MAEIRLAGLPVRAIVHVATGIVVPELPMTPTCSIYRNNALKEAFSATESGMCASRGSGMYVV